MLENLPWVGLAFFVQFWWPKFVRVAAEAGAAPHCAHCWWSRVFKAAFQSAALSAGTFGSPLGKLQRLFTFQFSRDPCFLLCLTGPGEELSCQWACAACSFPRGMVSFAEAWIAQE